MNIRITVDRVPHLDQFGVQPGIGRVEHLGAVERQPEDMRLASLEQNVLVIGVVHGLGGLSSAGGRPVAGDHFIARATF